MVREENILFETKPLQSVVLREPHIGDGLALHRLVAACPPLDANSVYCNLLQCTHFGGTAIVAERYGALIGSITGYRLPARADTLFVWQVAVAPAARGQGLAARLLGALLERCMPAGVRYLETSVNPENRASRRLFERTAQRLGAALEERLWFERERHFDGAHSDEILLRIGPFGPARGTLPTEQR